ncbi:DgyrCDS14787 [Dimorphilus gyrociliatus]|uniref:DgyrCDS14787 n=1 Tax=Dimorphilus gyrociliatus TaxID=2664684 RepID=A0A7I8WF07_9ANNE|nr:DgyrCDS14787 [Dimorphilus gyrociliatus]
MSCSILNCDYCEVIGDKVECLRSPCASKASSVNNKKFSFSSKTCAASCPSDLSCATKKVNDENEACFCRSCPVILAGANAGVCKSCGTDCEDCQLSADKMDVECKTCKGSKQWVSIEVSSSLTKGCYDCTIASPQCKVLELSGGSCRCKSGECMGDTSIFGKHTVLQAGSGYQGCKACVEEIPNVLWCSGPIGSATVDKCQYDYTQKIGAEICLYSCAPCPAGCSDCDVEGVNPVFCTACTDPNKLADPSVVANTNKRIGDCVPGAPAGPHIAGCLQQYNNAGGGTLDCVKCANNKEIVTSSGCDSVTGCKENYSIAGGAVVCMLILQHCKGYFASAASVAPANSGRCAGCDTGFVLDYSPTKYDCISCTAAGLDHCTLAVSSGGTCMCGRCTADAAGKVYHKHPTLSGCTENNEIPNCSAHTLKLKNGVYVVACTTCTGAYILAEDGLSCVVSSKPCTGGTKVVAAGATTCTCDCGASRLINSAGDDCIACVTAGKTGCSESTRALCLSFGCGAAALRDSEFNCDSCASLTGCDICVKQIGDTLKCLKCNTAYYMDSNSVCQSCVFGCDFCVDGTTCIPNGCKDGYIRHRTEGTCIQCTGSGVSRCAYETATSDTLIPKICKTGYTLNTITTPVACEKCNPNCKSCSTNGKDKCDTGQCNSGYFLDSSDQKCYNNKAGCLASTRSNEKTTCSSCNRATSILSNGECKTCPTGCSGCSFDAATSKFTCLSCIAQYYKTTDNLCLPCPTGCSVCSLNGASVECTSCLAKYDLKGALCDLCGIGDCQTCSVPSGGSDLVCLTCSNKFYLNSDDCGHCPKFCKECSYNQKYECTKCYDKYAKALDGTCVPCPSNCETCTANADKTTRCTKCISKSFSLKTDGTCIPCSEAAFANCSTCGPTPLGGKAKCDTCSIGFALQDDKLACISCSITGCGMCAHGRICLKCRTMKVQRDDFICVFIVKWCHHLVFADAIANLKP